MRISTYLLLLVTLAGCATTPVTFTNAQPVPNDRVYAHQDEAESTLLVTRDNGFVGGGCKLDLFIDGERSATFGAGESAAFYVPAGDRILAVKAVGICGPGSPYTEQAISVSKGKKLRLRIFIGAGGYGITQTTI